MICSLSQSILESVKELASLLYNEMYNFCSQQLDNCSELDPLSTGDHPVMLGPITRRLACEVEFDCQNSSHATLMVLSDIL